MIILTGAAGFIGSYMLQYLNESSIQNVMIVDIFSSADKSRNWKDCQYKMAIEREAFLQMLHDNDEILHEAEAIIHLGARTDTTSTETAIFEHLNLAYTKSLWSVRSIEKKATTSDDKILEIKTSLRALPVRRGKMI